MIIERKSRQKAKFEYLDTGALFEFDEEVFLKVTPFWAKENSLNLKNCEKHEFERDTLVVPLKGKLVIE